MKCPYQVEPHQIQGLDCIHVFPVVQVIIYFLIIHQVKIAITIIFSLLN